MLPSIYPIASGHAQLYQLSMHGFILVSFCQLELMYTYNASLMADSKYHTYIHTYIHIMALHELYSVGNGVICMMNKNGVCYILRKKEVSVVKH